MSAGSPLDPRENRRGALGPGQRALLAATIPGLPFGGGEALRAYAAAIEADLAEGRVEAIDGEIVFSGQKIAEVSAQPVSGAERGTQLLTACLSAYTVKTSAGPAIGIAPGIGLLPGPYRLYVAPRAKLVVGGEVSAAAVASGEHERRMGGVLREVQQITEETLVANRAGRMTEAQRGELGRLPPSHIAYGVAVMAAVMAGLTAMGVMRAMESGDSLFGFRTIGGAIVTLVLLAYLPVAVREQRRSGAGARADVAEGRLEVWQGELVKSHLVQRATLSLTLRMNENDLDVSDRPALFAAVVEGRGYRVYVAPRSRRLIALELAASGR